MVEMSQENIKYIFSDFFFVIQVLICCLVSYCIIYLFSHCPL